MKNEQAAVLLQTAMRRLLEGRSILTRVISETNRREYEPFVGQLRDMILRSDQDGPCVQGLLEGFKDDSEGTCLKDGPIQVLSLGTALSLIHDPGISKPDEFDSLELDMIYIDQLNRMVPIPDMHKDQIRFSLALVGTDMTAEEFETHAEPAILFVAQNTEALLFALSVANNLPRTWDDQARAKIKAYAKANNLEYKSTVDSRSRSEGELKTDGSSESDRSCRWCRFFNHCGYRKTVAGWMQSADFQLCEGGRRIESSSSSDGTYDILGRHCADYKEG